MTSTAGVPPGFRFHPTDEELLHYYLNKKVSFQKFDLDVIREVDLNKIEPWDLQERCRIGSTPQNEWYFFSHKDKKYPTGSRTNRATGAGFWKATGRDKCIRNSYKKIGMRKTLVFYKGRAPHGQKTDWIMHEYRLEENDDVQGNEEGWVVCRVFKKKNFFKVGNEGGSTSLCIDHDADGDFGPLQAAHHHKDNMRAYIQHHNTMEHHQAFYPVGLQFSGINYMPAVAAQVNIPQQHSQKLLGYDFVATAADTGGAPLLAKQFLTMQSNSQMGYHEGARVMDAVAHNAGGGGAQQMVAEMREDQNLNDWAMLDKFVAAGTAGGGGHNINSQDDGATTSRVALHMNPLSLRNEMDLWTYGKQ